ncbi:SGNH/GDSL hydrolase family protein [Undibacterium sp. CY18W]|uniref:SGNH/GDSL hydrolase family protein n=1 Tax=Undibacterium hunanense TaxID=2762292 RepID=A0ABR6ZKZ6_9BURK|nr:SGNH/GDSL hydrolase family protein [Undibacterium hunanense]MBC3916543.1 SGNH/GDSL hydrolase family protein [Undibacterium hunanense]
MKFVYLPELLAVALYPVLAWQGRRTRAMTPRLPEAAGQPFGLVGDAGQTGKGLRPLKLLGIGESPVAGVGVVSYEQAITAQLAQALAGKLDTVVEWHALGQNGARLNWARNALRQFVHAGGEVDGSGDRTVWDVVLIAFGVNDTTSFCPATSYQRELTALINELQNTHIQAHCIILAGVPPMHVFPALPQALRLVLGMKARVLDQVQAQIAASVSHVLHVPFIGNFEDEHLMAEDGYHPSALGVSIWAEEIAKIFVENRREK